MGGGNAKKVSPAAVSYLRAALAFLWMRNLKELQRSYAITLFALNPSAISSSIQRAVDAQ